MNKIFLFCLFFTFTLCSCKNDKKLNKMLVYKTDTTSQFVKYNDSDLVQFDLMFNHKNNHIIFYFKCLYLEKDTIENNIWFHYNNKISIIKNYCNGKPNGYFMKLDSNGKIINLTIFNNSSLRLRTLPNVNYLKKDAKDSVEIFMGSSIN